jgi:DNA helicase-2/ATP-dependent DNA helicase PcrA
MNKYLFRLNLNKGRFILHYPKNTPEKNRESIFFWRKERNRKSQLTHKQPCKNIVRIVSYFWLMSELNYNRQFLEELDKLNPAQKEAVESLEGPVLVVAGPGTGKTQILAARIGNILLKTDARPHNILCLTYTDAGAISMRKRLLRFIGPDAYRVHIHTFHSFCNTVIQENLDHFGLRALEPLSELEKIEVIREIIDEFGSDNPLKRWRGDVYYDTPRLDRLFQIMKKENWRPELIREKVRLYLEELPFREEYIYKTNGKNFKKGEVKQKNLDAEKEKMDALLAGVAAFNSYQQKLRNRNRYDFSDMILWVLDAFRQEEDILRNYQERYLYYLVDEFQDTSGAQSGLLDLLVDYWDDPNVFVVGDDDQSIYAFQDANVRNILNFASKYRKSLKTVMMTENYRSTQQILDLAGGVIENNKERLVVEIPGLEKRLRAAGNEAQNTAVLPELKSCFNEYHETVHVARAIADLGRSGVPFKEIAVIYRNHRQASDISAYLQAAGIPLNIRKRLDILEQPLVEQIINILHYLAAERKLPHSGEHYLFHLLHYEFFGLSPIEISRLAMEVSRKNQRGRVTSFREEMSRYGKAAPDLFSQPDFNPFRRVSADIEYWIRESFNLTLQQLLEKIINRGGILRMVLESPEKIWLMELIHTFFEFVKDECARDTRMTLETFLDMLALMRANRIELPVNKVSYSAEGVNFLTAHSSKGLEFDYVFLIGCDSRTWQHKGQSSAFRLPDNLAPNTLVDENEESRRLFYVSLTRARKYLSISWPSRTVKDKELEAAAFVAEAEAAGIATKEFIVLEDEELLDFQMKVLQEQAFPDIALVDKEFLAELLQKYTMSVTHLNSFLKCPLSFYFDNLIRVPRAKSPSMTFGSAVHYALERMFKKMQEAGNGTFPPAGDMVKDFEWYMRRNEDSFTRKDFDLKVEYGRKILETYYLRYVHEWKTVMSAEVAFSNIEVSGIPLNGKMDKVEFDQKNVCVVDYKTGSYENARAKFGRPDHTKEPDKRSFEEESGGDYWRQAVFYKILIDHDRARSWKMVSVEFDFVEPDKKTGEFRKEKVLVTQEDEQVVKQQIQEAYSRIMALDFSGCGKEGCSWCSFVKNHYRLPAEKEFPAMSGEE